MIITKTLTTDASGSASETFNINGYIDAIGVDYDSGADAGTDLTYDGTNKVSGKYQVDRIKIEFAQGGASKTNKVVIGVDING